MRRVLGFEHEHRLREIELAGDLLHLLGGERVSVMHDRERIAAVTLLGKDIECMKVELHRLLGWRSR